KMSLIFLLAFVGVKMLLTHHVEIPSPVSLAFLLGILSVGIIASIYGGDIDAKSSASGTPPSGRDRDLGLHTALRAAARVVVGIVGATVVALGLAMLVLPGPGILVIPFGLAILATEFVWARRWLQRIRGNGSSTQIAIRKAS